MFLARYGGDEGALAAAHVPDHADQLAGLHVAAAVLEDDALRRVAVLAVVHVGRQRSVVGTASKKHNYRMYRVVQLNFTPETEVPYMLFDRSLSIFSMTSLKQHSEYFNFRC